MEEIFEANDQFNFNKLVLTKPVSIPGGNFFIRFLVNSSHLYIQPPKCKTKQGIIKAGKRIYTDLMFTHEDDQFIRWMENLENHCQQHILQNRDQWFEGDLELHDIENYFTSPLKVYKSGTCYTVRTNITTMLGKPGLKIYDEQENEVDMDTINDKMNIMTILEIQGIKCSARSFQIEIELKQMLSFAPVNIFDKCLLIKKPSFQKIENADPFVTDPLNKTSNTETAVIINTDSVPILQETIVIGENLEQTGPSNNIEVTIEEPEPISDDKSVTIELEINDQNSMEEVEFNLEELPQDASIQIKQRNDVYYEMYREARRKAKIARDLALSSYLEVKRIKNTYMLDDIKDSEDESEDDDSISEEPTTVSLSGNLSGLSESNGHSLLSP